METESNRYIRHKAELFRRRSNSIHWRPATSGDKSENPDIELQPAQMQKLKDADQVSWVKYAHGLHDAAMVALKAIDTKNLQGLMDAGETIDNACENCHKHYWYPDEKPVS